MSTQQPSNGNPLTLFINFLASMLDLFIDPKTGRIAPDRVIVISLICIAAAGYMHRDDLFKSLSDSNKSAAVEVYQKAQEDSRLEKLGQEVRTNSQRLLAIFNPDITGVWIYKPQDKHYFMELVYFEGTLPDGTTVNHYKNIAVDRGSREYVEHSNSIPYISNGLESTLASITNTSYFVYSCPLYNKYGYYQGKVSMYWKSIPDSITERRYYTECSRSSRQISQYLDTNNELVNLFE